MKLTYCLFLLLFINFIDVGVFSTQLFPANRGGSIGRDSREPKYKIEFHTEDAPFHPSFGIRGQFAHSKRRRRGHHVVEQFLKPLLRRKSKQRSHATWTGGNFCSTLVGDDQESLVMRNKSGDKYNCYLPKVEKSKSEKPVSQQNTSSLILEMERPVKLETPDELLDVLKDLCLVRQEGWWTYEFCYHKKLRQIHVEDEKVLQEFILGEYDAAATEAHNQNMSDITTLKDPRSKDASLRYHPHQYTNGTTCDLTNQPRETEVRFVCADSRTMIASITELSTCKYALTVQSLSLCKHPLFHAEKPEWHTINCNLLPKAEEEKVQEENIFMITNAESSFSSEGFAT